MTRACRRLVLVGQWPERPEQRDPLDSKNYIDLLQSRAGLPTSLAEPANDPSVHLLGHWDDATLRWRFLGGTRKHRSGRPLEASADWLPDVDSIGRIADRHDRRSSSARRRMDRPWSAAATSDISSRLEAAASSLRDDEEPAAAATRRRAAREVGSAVHDCLEHWHLDEDPAAELDRQRGRLAALLPDDPDLLSQAVDTLERFAAGSLLKRLRALHPHLIGREVPVLVGPPDSAEGPVGCYSGAIDMLYRDPVSGDLVVADFKTDRVEGPENLVDRAEVYRPQEELYARAVQEMMRLADPPRTELWFLWAGQVVQSGSEVQ